MPVELAVAAMRRKRVNLIVWASITASLVAIIVAFYPSIKGDASLDKTFADFPETVRALFGTNIARLAFALALTILTIFLLRTMDIGAWLVAIAACLVFPLVGLLSGLFPNPRRSPLFA